MDFTSSHRWRWLVAAAVVALILGVATYTLRDQLTGVSFLRALRTSDDAAGRVTPSADRSAMSMDMAGMDMSAEAPVADPRADIRLDLRRRQLSGVRTAPVERAAATQTLRTVGVVAYDETRLVDVNLQIEGWIRELHADFTGKFVERGDPLFTLYSPELLSTEQEYVLALETRDALQGSQVSEVRDHAERLVASARRRLELWDLPVDHLEMLDATGEAQPTVTFRSPSSGYVIEKTVVQGAHVAPGQMLYRIADLSRVWVDADVYERETSLVAEGRAATVTLDAYPGERFAGRVVYVYPYVDASTRAMKVRLELPNPRGRLRPGMFANVELEAPLGMSTLVPADAIVDSGQRQLVFVAEGDGYFLPRDVRVGRRLGDRVQILEGVEEGEQVATSATFFLDSESQLRASVQAFTPRPTADDGAEPAERLAITLRPQPDPPRTGDNMLEVSVADAAGQSISDADVSVIFFMAAMPTMNMPAMRNEVRLPSAGDGVYRGTGRVMMAGRWDVTVTVTRDGQTLGVEQFTLVAQ